MSTSQIDHVQRCILNSSCMTSSTCAAIDLTTTSLVMCVSVDGKSEFQVQSDFVIICT